MTEKTITRTKLGIFVLAAITFLILGLYYIGSKKNIFHSTITAGANFSNVGGLLPGNNVRYNGINVGTVSKIYPINDTAIRVEFSIDKSMTEFIANNALVSIGTDGLLGNKLINITPPQQKIRNVMEGDILNSENPIQMDVVLKTLTKTNENLNAITGDLKEVTKKFNSDNMLWRLLSDSTLTENLNKAVVQFKITGDNTAILTGDLRNIVKGLHSGKGSIGALLTDTTFSHKLNQTIITIQKISDSLAIVSGNFSQFSEKLQNKDGLVGTVLTDTMFVHNLNQSLDNLKNGTGNFNQNMEALKHSWPFKKYFRKLAKQKKD